MMPYWPAILDVLRRPCNRPT